MSLSCLSHVKRTTSNDSRPTPPTLYTDVVWCGDRSGSMSSMGPTPVQGAKTFMKDHRRNAQQMKNIIGYHIDYTTFDDIATTKNYTNAANITDDEIINDSFNMVPRGTTKFYDTAIACISRQQKRLDNVKKNLTYIQKRLYYENSHLINSVFATFTDGYDNASIANSDALRRAIQKHEEEYGVVCMFLAANISAEECGERFGFNQANCMQMGSDPITSSVALRSCSAAMTRAVTEGATQSQFTQMERNLSAPTQPILQNTFNHNIAIPPSFNSRINLRQPASPMSPSTMPTVPAVPVNTPVQSPHLGPNSGYLAATAAIMAAGANLPTL